MENMQIKIHPVRIEKCMKCGAAAGQGVEILVTLEFMPSVTFRLLLCQSCLSGA